MEDRFLTPELWMLYQYKQNDIDKDIKFTRKNRKIYSVGQLWWNEISRNPFVDIKTCSKCREDTKIFCEMIKKGENVDKFEHKFGKREEEKRRRCPDECFWYWYFREKRRVELKRKK